MLLFLHSFFGRNINILVEFIPQIIFLVFLFGYLCILMFIKWTKYYAGAEERNFSAFYFSKVYFPKLTTLLLYYFSVKLTPGCAPSILITFIGMVLFKYDKGAGGDCDPYMYPGQVTS